MSGRYPARFLAAVAALAVTSVTFAQPAPDPPPAGAAAPAADPKPAAEGAKPEAKAGDAAKPAAPAAGWDDQFFLRSADKRFSLRITGQVQGDYRAYLDPNDRTDIDGFAVRRARFGLEATLFRYYEFRFLPDFGLGQDRLQDAYMNVRHWDAFQVTVGKFKQPFSYEQLIQDRFTPLEERSLIDQLVPARDVGVMLHGQNLFAGRLDYGVAVANGERDGNTDTNDAKDVTVRLAVRPFAAAGGSPLRLLQLGVAGGVGNQAEPVNPAVLRTPAGVPFFAFNRAVVASGRRSRLSPEVAYFLGGFGFAAQYFRMEQRLSPAGSGPGAGFAPVVPFDGFYAQATYLLTGEGRTTYSQPVAPRRPLDPGSGESGWGAWELVGRASRLRAGGVVFAPGGARLADPAAVSNGATEVTLGVNWYVNRWVRVQLNWEHAWFDRPVRLGPGPGGLLRGQDTIETRLQFIF